MPTGVAKYPYPQPTAVPDVPADLLLLTQRLALMNGAGIGYVADAAELTATITNSDAFTGWSVYHAAADCVVRYNGAAFKISGTKRFASAAAQTSWTSTYSGLLEADALSITTDTGITYRYNGSAWDPWESGWITWATAPTNLTVGTGGSAASVQRYKWIGGRLWFAYSYTLGSSGASMGTTPTINLPISVALTVAGGALATGDGAIRDVSGPSTPAFVRALVNTATTAQLLTYTGTTASITATAPMTWAAGDILAGGFWADPA